MTNAVRSFFVLLGAVLLTACTTVDLKEPGSTQAQSPDLVLSGKIDGLLEQQRAICMEARYAALRAKSPCKSSDINFTQMSDRSKITSEQRSQLVEATTRMDQINKEITSLYRAFNTSESLRIADARSWAHEQSLKNRLSLADGNLTWGQYLEQRTKIEAEMLRRAR